MQLKLFLCIITILIANFAYCSNRLESDTSINMLSINTDQLNSKAITNLQNRYNDIGQSIDKQSLKLLSRIQGQENQLKKMVELKDSLAAKKLFDNAEKKYNVFRAKLQSPVTKIIPRPLQEYVPRLDSLQTVFRFLGQSPNGTLNVSTNNLQGIQGLDQQLQQVQGRFQQAGEIKEFIQQREQDLKNQLTQYGLSNKLLGYNKEVYYYQQQLADYKTSLNDPEKIGQAILGLVRKLPVFQAFMQKNSYLGTLFPMPDNYGTPQALAGLQTRASISSVIATKINGSTAGIGQEQYLQQQIQAAQQQLSALKDKVTKAGGGCGEQVLPQFTPNSQKTKSFSKRLEYGFIIQSQQGTLVLPITTTFGLTTGYKFTDRVTAGLGVSYILGWGSGWNHISVSNQGVGVKSYVDVKAKGSIWITGGFEYNYFQAFAKWQDIASVNVWQKSVLLGLEKKYKIGKQNSNIQLLYDFLWNTELPQGQPIKFRMGYTF